MQGPCRVETVWNDVNGGIEYTERVQGAKALSLLQWYASRHAANASVDSWRASIEGGQVRINGQAVTDPEAPIPPNATLVYRRPGWVEPDAPAFLDVLWWDAHVVAVHKPPGLQVMPAGPFYERCALTLLRQFHAQHASELEGVPAPVHRIGRGTTGVLICACSGVARSALSRAFAEHGASGSRALRKVYRTAVQGLVAADEGDIDTPIGRTPYPGVSGGLWTACPAGAPDAKPSRSRYTVLHRDAAAGTTLVDVEIFTGRPHQIRIHMAAIGHPLVGDELYEPGGLPTPQPPAGAAAAADGTAAAAEAAAPEQQGQRLALPGDCGYLLHSQLLEFTHPVTGERLTATCEPPPALRVPSPPSSDEGTSCGGA